MVKRKLTDHQVSQPKAKRNSQHFNDVVNII